jgi:hypothetical protein
MRRYGFATGVGDINVGYGHTKDLRDDFFERLVWVFFETNTQFEIFTQQNQINSRKQPFKSRDR